VACASAKRIEEALRRKKVIRKALATPLSVVASWVDPDPRPGVERTSSKSVHFNCEL
jgi:hypothetical protein